MDQYVRNKLKRWKLDKYIGIFRENEVSRDNFLLLTDDAIAGLIPYSAIRAVFLRKYEHLKMTIEKRTEEPTTSHLQELQEIPSPDSLQKSLQKQENAESLHEKNLQEVLSKNRFGRQILNTLKSGKPPTNFLRKKLAVFLFDNLLQSCGNNPTAELKMELAKKIVEEFPQLYIEKNDNASHIEDPDYQVENDETLNIENQMEIEIEPPMPEYKEVHKTDDLCDICSKETSVYKICSGICKRKFCNDCCSFSDLRNPTKTSQKNWKCIVCQKSSTSNIYSQQKGSVSHEENLETDTDSPDSSDTVSITIDPSQALEFYTSAPAGEPSESSTSRNYSEADNICIESDIPAHQEDASDTRLSGTVALICNQEPIIKKEADLSYDRMPFVEEAHVEVTPVVYPDDATSSQGNNSDVPAAENKKKLKEFDIRAILERTEHGKDILRSIEQGDTTVKTRRAFTRILVQYLIDKYGLYLRKSILQSAAVAIDKQFLLYSAIFGGQEAWYSTEPKIKGDGRISTAKSCCRGFLYQRLTFVRRKNAGKKKKKGRWKVIKKKDANKSLQDHKTQKKPQKVEYTVSEKQRAQDVVMSQLNEIWEDMSSCYAEKDENWKIDKADKQETRLRSPERTVGETDAGIAGTTIDSDDECVSASKDEEFRSADEEDGLTLVAFEDYCNLKRHNDMLEEELKKERKLRQNAEEKLAQVQAEKTVLEREILDIKSRRTYTRWKHNTSEYCRKTFQ